MEHSLVLARLSASLAVRQLRTAAEDAPPESPMRLECQRTADDVERIMDEFYRRMLDM